MLGSWTNEIHQLRESFQLGEPYENVTIPNFFTEEFATRLERAFPSLDHPRWFRYYTPLENKYALNNFSELLEFRELFDLLQSDEFIAKIREITNIPDLEKDTFLHGAGIHYHPRRGKLDMHLDYNIHPISKKERRVNLIIYLNREWQESWNGGLELWDHDFINCVKRVMPGWNMGVLFRTSDISYHGMPQPFECPEGMGRKSIAIYYLTNPRQETLEHPRYKAQFFPLPWQPMNDQLAEVYRIRKERILSKSELDRVYPNWENEGGIFW
jgi:Rps23 Pro-64 3,4-dihydroxylase Tpa1-like proline 4-hydroxylase